MKSAHLQRIIILAISLCSGFFILLTSDAGSPGSYYWTIPMIFGPAYFLCFNISAYMRGHLGLLFFNMILIVRYIVTPAFAVWGGYFSNLAYSTPEITKATGLMIYEMIAVMAFIHIFSPRFYAPGRRRASHQPKKDRLELVGAIVPLTIMMGTGILVSLFFQTAKSVFSFVFTSKTVNFLDLSRTETPPFEGVIVLFVQWSMLFLCCLVIQHFYKKRNFRGFLRNGEFVLLLATIVLTSSLILYSSRSSVLFPMIAGFFLIGTLFEEKKAKLKLIGVVVILVLLIGLTIKKQFRFETTSDIVAQKNVVYEAMPYLFSQYSAGLFNVIGSIQTKSQFSNQFPPSKLITDLLSRIAFLGRWFRQDFNASNYFNYTLSGNYRGSQILPMSGIGYLYFGFFLSPLLSILSAFLFMWCDRKAKAANDVFSKYLFLFASIKFGLFMTSNALILFGFFINYFLLARMIIWISRKTTFGQVMPMQAKALNDRDQPIFQETLP